LVKTLSRLLAVDFRDVHELWVLLVEDVEHGGLLLRPDGLWDVRPVYLGAG
jgi:hypothetical protein